MSAHTIQELQQYQALTLEQKIEMTKARIKAWVDHYGIDGVYVSFSGGKDSTVLLHIARQMYPTIKAMFVDVPTQYPELRSFVEKFDNVDIMKSKMSFMEVCEKYGFPMISKEVSNTVCDAKKYLTRVMKKETGLTDRQTDRQHGYWAVADLLGINRRMAAATGEEYQNLKKGIIPDYALERLREFYEIGKKEKSTTSRTRQLFGEYEHREKGVENGEYSKQYDRSKYIFFLKADFNISDRCCKAMKKEPAHRYAKETGRTPITAQMASESKLRTSQWLMRGCNSFDTKTPMSNPMAFWVENDVLTYIYENNVEICSVYGDVVVDYEADGQVDGQLSLSEYGVFDKERPSLKCTGCQRTGCCLCGFGAHLEKPGEERFLRLKETHPGMYNLLDVIKNNGVTYREAIEWVNENSNGKVNIKL